MEWNRASGQTCHDWLNDSGDDDIEDYVPEDGVGEKETLKVEKEEAEEVAKGT